MKKVSLLMAFIAFFATASFAGTSDQKAVEIPKAVVTEVSTDDAAIDEALQDFFKPMSCTVTSTWSNGNGGTVTLTATASCDNCTRQQACDAAYALISILIPG